ncbi:ribonuclease Oy [Lingula anatina]|uniref:Ribonuclease Oy n=1 Tax=Lingula anatina TaxID=7574 RepID=A0A1S3IDK3_LINAN|nr:ribonuclease Oy [Lingula anatina]|eukprot:XP_013396317.1 ribonuclease Oy [Lingula anatina]
MRIKDVLLYAVFIVSCSSNNEWDYMVFTQQWPQTVCDSVYEEHKCAIPKDISFWTVHGLWPNRQGSKDEPSYCNKTWAFDEKLIKPIETNLDVNWPNLYTDSEKTEFWQHEWDKHGTCAASLPALGSQFKYFSKGLELHQKYNATILLARAGVVPSDTCNVNITNLYEGLKSQLGKMPNINCYWNKKKHTQNLIEVELCVDKSFSIIDCNSNEDTNLYFSSKSERMKVPHYKTQKLEFGLGETEPCRPSELTCYPVIKHTS